jgi:CRP-like cAMP-binding protein
MTIAPGAEAFAKGSEAAILIVLAGSLRVEGEDQAGTATAGDVIGIYETLAGSPIHAKVTANKESNVLRIDRRGLFELLADHTDLLQGTFSILLRSTLARASAGNRPGSTTSNTVSTP